MITSRTADCFSWYQNVILYYLNHITSWDLVASFDWNRTESSFSVYVYFLINKQEIQGVLHNIKHLCNIRALQIGAFVQVDPGRSWWGQKNDYLLKF